MSAGAVKRVTRESDCHGKGANWSEISETRCKSLAAIAAEIGLERLEPEWLGASIVIEGVPDFSHVPPSARLQTGAGTTLVVDMQNRPCHYPGKEIEKDFPGHGKAFKAAAKGRRGVTAWVEREGPLKLGDTVRLHIPNQRAWQPQSTELYTAAE